MEDLIKEAKNNIERGFKEIGEIEKPSKLEIFLIGSTIKTIRLTDSIILLCNNHFNDEALIILRSLIELSINMRWITKEDTENRLEEYLSDLEKIEFGSKWSKIPLDQKMINVGYPNKDYYDFVVKLTYSHSHINASVLKLVEILNNNLLKDSYSSFSNEAIYAVTAQMLGHVLKSLDTNFKGTFSSHNDIWKKIKIDKKDIREEIEKIKRKLD
jgi:hypothetical protein